MVLQFVGEYVAAFFMESLSDWTGFLVLSGAAQSPFGLDSLPFLWKACPIGQALLRQFDLKVSGLVF
jgi:hypothetical protein